MRKFLLTLTTVIALFFTSTPILAEDFSVATKHAIAVEVSSGKILYEQDAETKASIASISKTLSIYLVYEALAKGEITLDTMVDISDYPYSLTSNTELSNVNLDTRSYSVRDLLNASLITSSNSAIIALAEKIAGSEAAFVDRMKAKVQEWGITDAKIVNVSGLDNTDLGENIYPGSSPEDVNMFSALDVAIIARRLILDYPQVLDITSLNAYDFGGYTYYSTNQMLSDGTHARGGVDGLKTGTSNSAGSSFLATTQQAGMRIITVVLNATDGLTSPENRFVATNDLMNYVYSNFSLVTLVKKGEAFEDSKINVFNGEKETSPVVAAADLTVVQRNQTDNVPTATFTTDIKEIDAPLKAGTLVGKLQLKDQDLIGKGYISEQASVDMIIPSDMKEASWPFSWWNQFVRYVNEKL
ncbi:D-alanyl-D-alanine carboxypeptidase PBP3 [Streptococcus suis]|uniref:D-alanyl-D-alanine carboxypeptidase PBP3 n=1 Tax=Streptococcus suis TaxID=1307 RepID=UPI00032A44E4|nr:D-alanyl-D-alanine carboxypeptidase PBP3 [Streptococcus suis]AGL48582.1 D-alanyl-D-alanine carboxypeptidase [Streptococcus suis TL13]MBY4959742.1 D-alanyl-D-alanine carboxypeptidase PBP3 [Streptococcus suis]MBY5027435.1 D-alanyl-D-alanine carboxypeptidase PBP3 [Streptococcus suis]MBY6288045.1 D-alanyl-D-alanine carboxypeptidase PBP3 [Streptococcus suis]MBY6295147.1 D-alanyl-D-alanine carboxypeptidase PBP3 [Streptococcus suis]